MPWTSATSEMPSVRRFKRQTREKKQRSPFICLWLCVCASRCNLSLSPYQVDRGCSGSWINIHPKKKKNDFRFSWLLLLADGQSHRIGRSRSWSQPTEKKFFQGKSPKKLHRTIKCYDKEKGFAFGWQMQRKWKWKVAATWQHCTHYKSQWEGQPGHSRCTIQSVPLTCYSRLIIIGCNSDTVDGRTRFARKVKRVKRWTSGGNYWKPNARSELVSKNF